MRKSYEVFKIKCEGCTSTVKFTLNGALSNMQASLKNEPQVLVY